MSVQSMSRILTVLTVFFTPYSGQDLGLIKDVLTYSLGRQRTAQRLRMLFFFFSFLGVSVEGK